MVDGVYWDIVQSTTTSSWFTQALDKQMEFQFPVAKQEIRQ